MKVKISIGVVFLLLLVSNVSAEVFVFKIHYDEGKASVTERAVKEGFAPDRNIDKGDAHFDMFDAKGNLLESFRFDLPLKEFTDYSDEEGVHGGIVMYNKRDFSIVVPYHPDAGGIRIREGSKIILYEDLRERLGKGKDNVLFVLAGAAGLVLAAVIILIAKKR